MTDTVPRPDGAALLLFASPDGNVEAARALLDEAGRRGVPPEQMIGIGDAAADAATALLRTAGVVFREGGTSISLAGRRLAVLPPAAPEAAMPVFPSTPALRKLAEIEALGCDGVLSSCGLPFSQIVEGRLWHDPGALGRPADDGTPRVWYSLLVPDSGGARIEHHALNYDSAGAARRIGPSAAADVLETGLWADRETLPLPELRARGVPLTPGSLLWPASPLVPLPRSHRREPRVTAAWPEGRSNVRPLDPNKFRDPRRTAAGDIRASVPLTALGTLWFNTGTLCNIACRNCYIESSPRNDRLAYLGLADLRPYLDEIERDGWPTEEIAFTGGEPFMNPEILPMLEECLRRGFRTLVLTNAMRPMQRLKAPLLDLKDRLGERLVIRVSLDHFGAARHEEERGPGTWKPTLDGLVWLSRNGFTVAVAGRTMWGEDQVAERAGYARLFAAHGIPVDAEDPGALVLFPEMDAAVDVPEITTACWGILHKSPDSVMCASSRMVVKRRGAERAAVLACTLLPYDEAFELGPTLADADVAVPLNHPHCAKFCVLGGASCSR